MAASIRSNKDKEMAARLKREGVKRTTATCPICHKIIAIRGIYGHIIKCKGA